jgi:hypothetical protein
LNSPAKKAIIFHYEWDILFLLTKESHSPGIKCRRALKLTAELVGSVTSGRGPIDAAGLDGENFQ